MTEYSADNFERYIGKTFAVKGGRHALALGGVERGSAPGMFTLIFSGPPGDILPEGLNTFDAAGDEFALYVMPIHTPGRDRQDYQAVFN